jgi:polyisoprenoid-binding protein YceI
MAAVRKFAAFLLSMTLGVPIAKGADSRTAYTIDSKSSKIEIQVAREGFFKAFGHDHLVSAAKFTGEIHFNSAKVEDSSVSFSVDAKSLTVVDPGESEKDRKEVQDTMLGEQVLDTARYPQIQFSSSSVRVLSNKSGEMSLQVEGTLGLHGAKKTVVAPVHVRLADDGTLTADAEVPLLQSEFGITPIKIAGGTVRVKDKLKLTFHFVARKAS